MMMSCFKTDHNKVSRFDYSQNGVAPPYELGDILIDPLGEVTVIIQGFGVEDSEYRGDMNGVQPYVGSRYATLSEIKATRPDLQVTQKNINMNFFNPLTGEVYPHQKNSYDVFFEEDILVIDSIALIDNMVGNLASPYWGQGFINNTPFVVFKIGQFCPSHKEDTTKIILLHPKYIPAMYWFSKLGENEKNNIKTLIVNNQVLNLGGYDERTVNSFSSFLWVFENQCFLNIEMAKMAVNYGYKITHISFPYEAFISLENNEIVFHNHEVCSPVIWWEDYNGILFNNNWKIVK